MSRASGKAAELSDVTTTMKDVRELTRIAENEINRIFLDCFRARRQLMGTVGTAGPTRH